MKIFTKHSDHKPIYEKLLKDYSHVNFALYVDHPFHHIESPLNIMVLQEPDEYFGMHTWTLANKDYFQLILSWNDKVINNCPLTIYNPFGHTWLLPNQYETPKEKKFEISHLSGRLNKSYGHSLRHEILARQDEIKIPKNFYHTYGDRDDINKARLGKEAVFGNSMFNIAIENFSHRGYFTEKLLDCFLLRSIPVYWGCSNIEYFFNKKGIITFENIDDLIYHTEYTIDEDYYNARKDIIEENYKTALEYISFEQMVVDKVINVFKYNNLI